jgi:hypothetical protein
MTGVIRRAEAISREGLESFGETLYKEALFQKTGCAASALSALPPSHREEGAALSNHLTFLPRAFSPCAATPPYSESVPR